MGVVSATSTVDKVPFLWENGFMKNTMDLPDTLFTTVKVTAASEGISMKEFLTQAIQMRLKDAPGTP